MAWNCFYIILLIMVVASGGYQLLCLYSALIFGRRRQNASLLNEYPPISILKPIRGHDAEAYQNFESFCRQDYPQWQIIFGSMNPNEPALNLAQKLQSNFKDLDIRLVRGGNACAMNPKVATLLTMLPEARHSILVLCDSDIRVGPEYLRHIIAPFQDPNVGVVTCAYRGVQARTIGDLWEAFWINAGFFPGVILASTLGKLNFAMGSTIAVRRAVVDQIGGLEALGDYLADDYQLANRASQFGYQVVLSHYLVDTVLSGERFRNVLDRHLRWLKTIRVSQRKGHLGMFLTHTTALAALFRSFTEFASIGWIVFTFASLLQMSVLVFIGLRVMQDPIYRVYFWLIPLWDITALISWALSLFGNQIKWRGTKYILTRDGRLRPFIENSPSKSSETSTN